MEPPPKVIPNKQMGKKAPLNGLAEFDARFLVVGGGRGG